MVTVKGQLNSLPHHEALITTTYDFDWDLLDSIVSLDRGQRKTSVVITDKGCFQERMKTLPEPQPPWLCNLLLSKSRQRNRRRIPPKSNNDY